MTESTETRGFEDAVQAYAEEAMGKGTEGMAVFYIFLSMTTRTHGWTWRRQLFEINPANLTECKMTSYRGREKRNISWVPIRGSTLCLALCR